MILVIMKLGTGLDLKDVFAPTSDRLVFISVSLFVYFTKVCWFGLCGEENIVESSFPSFIFILAFAILLAEYDWFPEKLKNPSKTAVFVFKCASIMLVTDLLLKLVWDPFVAASSKILKTVADFISAFNNGIGLESDSILGCCAEILEDEFTHSLFLTFIAFVCLYWILDGLGIVRQVVDKIQYLNLKVTKDRPITPNFAQECKPRRLRRRKNSSSS